MNTKSPLGHSVDSFHGFKEKTRKPKGTNSSGGININPTHQFMEVITKASNQNQDYFTEDFPPPKPNKYVYSRENILDMWSPFPLPATSPSIPDIINEKSFVPVCKDDSLLREFRDVS